MNHSTWDLEVHAREMQRRRLREADRARQIESSRQRGDRMRVPVMRFSISRLLTAFRGYLSPQRGATDGATAPALPSAALLPLAPEERQLGLDVRPSGLSQPYAGMVVLARPASAQSTAKPCVASDC